VVVAVTFGVVVYIVVQAGAALSLYAVGLGVAVLLSAAAGVVAHRSAVGLEAAASRQTEKAREELALVGQLSAGLSGPLTPTEVATQFLRASSGVLPPTAVTTLLQYEETAGLIRILAEQGGGVTPRAGISDRRRRRAGEARDPAIAHTLGGEPDRRLRPRDRAGDAVLRPQAGRDHSADRPFDDAADAGKPLVLTSPTNSGAVAARDLAAQIAVAAPVVR
jgi:hypothetical protein